MIVFRLNNIEMPNSCGGCGLPLDLCDKWKSRNWGASRPADCPLVEIPPHGRLIDAVELEKEAQKRMLICDKTDNQFQKPYEIMRAIALAPTVIPAEENKE